MKDTKYFQVYLCQKSFVDQRYCNPRSDKIQQRNDRTDCDGYSVISLQRQDWLLPGTSAEGGAAPDTQSWQLNFSTRPLGSVEGDYRHCCCPVTRISRSPGVGDRHNKVLKAIFIGHTRMNIHILLKLFSFYTIQMHGSLLVLLVLLRSSLISQSHHF